MRRSHFSLLTLFAILAVASGAVAGNETGHGGGAIVCRNGMGQVTSAELLDLWEGKVELGLTIVDSSLPVEEQIATQLRRLVARSPLKAPYVREIETGL